jgi:hypothetical protein
MPGLVAFTAASDGTPALEEDAGGVFTSALLEVLAQASSRPLTYAQVARQVPPLVTSASYQIPYFQGDLNKAVFGNTGRTRPIGWDVVSTGDTIELAGPPLPGYGTGAELRVYDGAVSGDDANDPARAKATIVVDSATGLNAIASVTGALTEADPVEPGDIAVLVRPSNENLKLTVSFRAHDQHGGIPPDRAERLRELIANDREAREFVQIADALDQFELSENDDGKLVLRGPENKVRTVLENDRAAVKNLWQHARQKALLRLKGEGGRDFTDQETLKVSLVPADRQRECADGEWVQADPNEEQVIPLCYRWNIRVHVSADAPHKLLIGGLALSSDGSTYAFPGDGRTIELEPGADRVLQGITGTGKLPLDVQDHLLIFGTRQENPVQWHLLTESAVTRGNRSRPKAGLYGALDRYLKPATRGVGLESEDVEVSTWTMSSMTMRTEANSRFAELEDQDEFLNPREYTLASFDIRPYLPTDRASALYKVLKRADDMARSSVSDGYDYEQHGWEEGDDPSNLKKGIDCSRAIWFAFTRSELPYNEGNRYLTTADMVGENSKMSQQFDQCPPMSGYALGDVLVYRSDVRNDGHVVMVIDPKRRIAWGSHGWDGSARDAEYKIEPDTGVEYQLIKVKKDWARWDRSDMELKACWRYRGFDQSDLYSTEILAIDPCSNDQCPLGRNDET